MKNSNERRIERVRDLVQDDAAKIRSALKAGPLAASTKIDEASRRIKEAVDIDTVRALLEFTRESGNNFTHRFDWLNSNRTLIPGYVGAVEYGFHSGKVGGLYLWAPGGEVIEDSPVQARVGDDFHIASMALGKGVYRAPSFWFLRGQLEESDRLFGASQPTAPVRWAEMIGRDEPFTEGWKKEVVSSPGATYGSSGFLPGAQLLGEIMLDPELARHIDPEFPASGAMDELIIERSLSGHHMFGGGPLSHPAIEFITGTYLPELIGAGRNIN